MLRTKSMWIVPVKGAARAISGAGQVSRHGQVTGSVVIDASSFDTRNQKRDRHLRSEDFFDVAKYPTIEFHASGGQPTSSDKLRLMGTLKVRGIVQPLTLGVNVVESGDSVIASTDVEVDRSQWGMTWGTKMGVRRKSRVKVSAHFVRTAVRS